MSYLGTYVIIISTTNSIQTKFLISGLPYWQRFITLFPKPSTHWLSFLDIITLYTARHKTYLTSSLFVYVWHYHTFSDPGIKNSKLYLPFSRFVSLWHYHISVEPDIKYTYLIYCLGRMYTMVDQCCCWRWQYSHL